MINFFIDTDIFIDVLQKRLPFHDCADEIFAEAISGNIKLFAAAHSFLNIYYLNKKYLAEIPLREAINNLLDLVELIPVDNEILRRSVKSSHKDFEDAVQISCAYKIENLTAIVTRNLKDFSKAEVKVFAPDEALDFIKNKK